jgi:hypothetical protein
MFSRAILLCVIGVGPLNHKNPLKSKREEERQRERGV